MLDPEDLEGDKVVPCFDSANTSQQDNALIIHLEAAEADPILTNIYTKKGGVLLEQADRTHRAD